MIAVVTEVAHSLLAPAIDAWTLSGMNEAPSSKEGGTGATGFV